MEDELIYEIQIRGQVDEDDIAPNSPLKFTIEQANGTWTGLQVYSDQAGLVGFIRHLHGRGFILLSVVACPPATTKTV